MGYEVEIKSEGKNELQLNTYGNILKTEQN